MPASLHLDGESPCTGSGQSIHQGNRIHSSPWLLASSSTEVLGSNPQGAHQQPLFAEESLWPVPGIVHHPIKAQPCDPTQLFLFKHGAFHGLLWAEVCRHAKHLPMWGLGFCCPSLAWVKCVCPVPKLSHHLLSPGKASFMPAANSTPREAGEGVVGQSFHLLGWSFELPGSQHLPCSVELGVTSPAAPTDAEPARSGTQLALA